MSLEEVPTAGSKTESMCLGPAIIALCTVPINSSLAAWSYIENAWRASQRSAIRDSPHGAVTAQSCRRSSTPFNESD
jgi:hypothetical protein